jgi:Zn-dependent protease
LKILLALLAGAKLGKIGLTAGTMLLSVAIYAITFGWLYAVGFVGLLLVHELGHFIVARQKGYDVGAPVFIPFVGAWISLKAEHMPPENEAEIALAGPILGSVGAFVCYLYAMHDGGRIWYAIAYAGFVLNLFNLIPARPLDGGRVVRAVSEKIWFLGVPFLAVLFYFQPSPLIILILVLALPDLWRAIKGRHEPGAELLPLASRIGYGIAYLGLAATLAVAAFEVHTHLERGA